MGRKDGILSGSSLSNPMLSSTLAGVSASTLYADRKFWARNNILTCQTNIFTYSFSTRPTRRWLRQSERNRLAEVVATAAETATNAAGPARKRPPQFHKEKRTQQIAAFARPIQVNTLPSFLLFIYQVKKNRFWKWKMCYFVGRSYSPLRHHTTTTSGYTTGMSSGMGRPSASETNLRSLTMGHELDTRPGSALGLLGGNNIWIGLIYLDWKKQFQKDFL